MKKGDNKMTVEEFIQEYKTLLSLWDGKDLKIEQHLNDVVAELMEEYGIDVETLPPHQGSRAKTDLGGVDKMEKSESRKANDIAMTIHKCEREDVGNAEFESCRRPKPLNPGGGE